MNRADGTIIHVIYSEIKDQIATDKTFTRTLETNKQMITQTVTTKTFSATTPARKTSRGAFVNDQVTVHITVRHVSTENISEVSIVIAMLPKRIRYAEAIYPGEF